MSMDTAPPSPRALKRPIAKLIRKAMSKRVPFPAVAGAGYAATKTLSHSVKEGQRKPGLESDDEGEDHLDVLMRERPFMLPPTASEAKRNRDSERALVSCMVQGMKTFLLRMDHVVDAAVWRSFSELEMYKKVAACEGEPEEEEEAPTAQDWKKLSDRIPAGIGMEKTIFDALTQALPPPKPASRARNKRSVKRSSKPPAAAPQQDKRSKKTPAPVALPPGSFDDNAMEMPDSQQFFESSDKVVDAAAAAAAASALGDDVDDGPGIDKHLAAKKSMPDLFNEL